MIGLGTRRDLGVGWADLQDAVAGLEACGWRVGRNGHVALYELVADLLSSGSVNVTVDRIDARLGDALARDERVASGSGVHRVDVATLRSAGGAS